MIKCFYQLVMDPDLNPLQRLPKVVRFQVMLLLAYMWSVIFSIYIGMVALVGPSIAAHTLLLVGIFFTADIFKRARDGKLTTLRVARLVAILSGTYLTMRLDELRGRRSA